jgi:hypothetical protein
VVIDTSELYPIAVLSPPLVALDPENAPTYEFPDDVKTAPALRPTHVFTLPLTRLTRVPKPMAVLLAAVVAAVNASDPIDVFRMPVVRDFPALLPTQTF